MDGHSIVGRFARLGARMPMYNEHHAADMVSNLMSRAVDCEANPNLCEKPVSADSMTIPIAVGVCVPVVLAASFFVYLHRRSVARQRAEDLVGIGKDDDFGMSEAIGRKKSGFPEKTIGHKSHQLSMDMDMSTPYLLPPNLHGSQDSLNSLARSLNNTEDPYRPVTGYGNGDSGSMRSWKPNNRESAHTMASIRTGKSAPPRQNSLPKPAPTHGSDLRLDTTIDSQPQFAMASPRDVHPMEPMSAAIEQVPHAEFRLPEIQEPEPAMPRTPRMGLPERPKLDSSSRASSFESAQSARDTKMGVASSNAPKLELNLDPAPTSPAKINFKPYSAGSQFEAMPPPSIQTPDAPGSPHHDYNDNHPQFTLQNDGDDYDDDYSRGRPAQRHSLELHLETAPAEPEEQGLGLAVPQGDNRRLSVGLRPLPPSDIGESDDPEYRANRIRSFYKEYFEDIINDNPASRPPMPPPPAQIPQQSQGPPPQQRRPGPPGPPGPGPRRGPPPPAASYYEDIDEQFMGAGDAAPYYDPDSNAFVMPYAQPVTRRAMTPPPSRFRNGPPRVNHGSIGNMSGMSLGPRPGSSVSNRFNGSRPGSRAGSAMSGPRGRNPAPKPRGPPPSALQTLPTPSMLKDDALAIMNPLDFAPPETFADRVRGRSQSPSGGERRPYKLNVPIASPLASSYDEMAAMPSPHMLRKSGAFTGLDFAPPRKFGDGDNMSDAGSIRSYKSSVSKVNLQNIRDQAHLPDNTIFAADATSAKLRPQWGMRD